MHIKYNSSSAVHARIYSLIAGILFIHNNVINRLSNSYTTQCLLLVLIFVSAIIKAKNSDYSYTVVRIHSRNSWKKNLIVPISQNVRQAKHEFTCLK